MKRLLSLVLFVFIAISPEIVYAQTQYDIDETIERIYHYILDDTEEGSEPDYEQLSQYLSSLADSPLELNRATPDELLQLGFLTDLQVENLYYYIHEYGPVRELYELKLVDGFDDYLISLLLPFVTVNPNYKQPLSLGKLLSSSKSRFTVRLGGVLEKKRGYTAISPDELEEKPNSRYLGSPLYHSFSYRLTAQNKIDFGITMEKDAGEPFSSSIHKGYDSYSAHLKLTDIGPVSTLLIGDYRASFGQGLVLNNNSFVLGKDVFSAMRMSKGLNAKNSNDEFNYFRGVAATFKLSKRWNISALYSFRKMDADTTGGSFSRLRNESLHRTPLEQSYSHTLGMHVAAINAQYNSLHAHIGATLYYSNTIVPRLPDDKLQYLFAYRGQHQFAASIDYWVPVRSFFLFGEWALNQSGALATINGMSCRLYDRVSMMLTHRYYSPKYDLYFADGYARYHTNNEHGVSLSAKIEAAPYLKLSGLADVFSHPWLRPSEKAPTVGHTLFLKAEMSECNGWTAYVRYRAKKDDVLQRSLRLNVAYEHKKLKLSTVVEGNKADGTYGFMVLQDVSLAFLHPKLTLRGRYAYFNAENYANRMFAYETDALGFFMMPQYYGKGHRYVLTVNWHILTYLQFSIKWAQTYYTDGRKTIGSGLETIEGRHQSILRTTLYWQFYNRKHRVYRNLVPDAM